MKMIKDNWRIINEIKDIEVQISALDVQIKKYDNDKASALEMQKRLLAVRELLDGHIYWTKFFTLLEENTISEIHFTNFSMTGNEKVTLSAVGRDYKSAAKQLIAFKDAKDFVKNVRIDSVSAEIDLEEGEYLQTSFNVNLEFLPGIFLKPIE